ncbi:hypothetical protein SDRG_09850 [Saprolegnia diclina VS20]|uniref:Uncharacterized protein n=1 Tax=Saprolegnia diclina (strain VS20) TaxID=1156394 RepID=T0Q3Y7_SAPDV|nr:hypothetical protein SDRG_09850 [Saprolegnia diclina VS20]EQC32524.1 hypothetical protein SDRG_09850 [Saprolegnia diclina VS20]|eukprot:XP_008614025.1 hypothetical protein SDRG_09850 [Saprolegnia diclina VS20]
MSDDVSILVLLDECEDAVAHVTAMWGMEMDEEAPWHAAEAIAAECWATVHALCSADATAWCMDDKPCNEAVPVVEAILIATDDESSEMPIKKATLEDDLLDLEMELSLAMAQIQTVDVEAIKPSAPRAEPTPQRALPTAKKKKKRRRQRSNETPQSVWHGYQKLTLQSHVERQAKARAQREALELEVASAVQTRLQTTRERMSPPRVELPAARPPKSYLTTYYIEGPRCPLSSPVAAPINDAGPRDVLVSVYRNDDRRTMTRILASSWADLGAKIAYKLNMPSVCSLLRETARISPNGDYTKLSPVSRFEQLRRGDILCAIHKQSSEPKTRMAPPPRVTTPKAPLRTIRGRPLWDKHGRRLDVAMSLHTLS